MATIKVTGEGRFILVNDGEPEMDLWSMLEPNDRLQVASFLIGVTKISGAIQKSTLETFKEKCEHRLRTIEEYRPVALV